MANKKNSGKNANNSTDKAVKTPRSFDPAVTPSQPKSQPILGEVYVYLKTDDGKKFIWHAKNKAKLTTFSSSAAHQLSTYKGPSGQSTRQVMFDSTDEVAVRRILHWIETNDLNSPKDLTLALLPAEHVTLDVMKLHHAAYTIRVPKQYRDNDVHQAIFEAIAPDQWFTVEQFIQVHEWCFFDKAVSMQMKKKCAWRGIMGYLSADEETALVQYMIQTGIKDDCIEVEKKLKAELEKRERIKGSQGKGDGPKEKA